MIDRDRDADKLALAGGLGVLPFAFAIAGSWLWPLFNSAGNSVHQEYKLTEILTGFVLFGAIGMALGATLLWVRSKTETPEEESHH
jgi:hypothetical protein